MRHRQSNHVADPSADVHNQGLRGRSVTIDQDIIERFKVSLMRQLFDGFGEIHCSSGWTQSLFLPRRTKATLMTLDLSL